MRLLGSRHSLAQRREPRERRVGRSARETRPCFDHGVAGNCAARIAEQRIEHAGGVFDEGGALEQRRRGVLGQPRRDDARERSIAGIEQLLDALRDQRGRQLALRTQPLKRTLAFAR